MNYYQEITFLPEADIGISFLRDKVFKQIHLRLVEFKKNDGTTPLAIAFPTYLADETGLGNKLRIFSEEREILEQYDLSSVLSKFSDYVHNSSIRCVPAEVKGYLIFSRKQSKTNKERLARRLAKRKGIGIDEALASYASFKEKILSLPFLTLKSSTTGEMFRLYIMKEKSEFIRDGKFNTFGLSLGGSVPDF